MFSKKSYLLFGLVIICIQTYSQINQAVAPITLPDSTGLFQNLNKISQKYLGLNLSLPFDVLINEVGHNPEIVVDTAIAHTNYSNFYLRGYHTSFNPFNIPLDSVKLIIAERGSIDTRTKNVVDTSYYLQVVGIAVGQEQVKNLPGKLKSLHKEVNPYFSLSYLRKIKKKRNVVGEDIVYYFFGNPTPLLNITWQKTSDTEALIILTLQLHLKNSFDRM
jgi:hypothetical protein